MVLREQAAAIPNHLPGDDTEANVEASPEFVAVRKWDLPSPLGQFSSPRTASTAWF